MLQLVRKDLYFQRYFVIVYFVLSAFSFFFDMQSQNGFLVSMILISLVAISSSLYVDDKNKSERIFNSIPLLRKQVVVAKYVSFLLFILISLCITMIVSMCFQFIGIADETITSYYALFGEKIPWELAGAGFAIIALYNVVILPIIFAYGMKIAMYASIILPYSMMLFSEQAMQQLLGISTFLQNSFGSSSVIMSFVLGLCLLCIMTWLSICISVHCYKKRDL